RPILAPCPISPLRRPAEALPAGRAAAQRHLLHWPSSRSTFANQPASDYEILCLAAGTVARTPASRLLELAPRGTGGRHPARGPRLPHGTLGGGRLCLVFRHPLLLAGRPRDRGAAAVTQLVITGAYYR